MKISSLVILVSSIIIEIMIDLEKVLNEAPWSVVEKWTGISLLQYYIDIRYGITIYLFLKSKYE